MRTLWGTRTNFSLGESILTIEQAIDVSKERGFNAVAIADTMSVSALIDAAGKAKKAGIELISGCTLRVEYAEGKTFYPKVYVCNSEGFVKLLQTLSGAESGSRGARYLRYDQYLDLVATDCFVVTLGDARSAFSSAFSDSDADTIVTDTRARLSALQCVLELVAVDTPYFATQNYRTLAYAVQHDLPIILSAYACYANPDDADARDLMQAVAVNAKHDEGRRLIQGARDLSIPDYRVYSKRAIQSTLRGMELAENADALLRARLMTLLKMGDSTSTLLPKLGYRWAKSPISLPKMAPDEFAELRAQCLRGWKDRLHKSILGYQPDAALMPEYAARLKYELGVIKELGFSNYFLLVADVVNWAKSQGIVVGPGRGSVGGSLIAFLLGITDVDPIRFKLLFERFINPERLDLPDADLDFMSARRGEVIQYLRGKYGDECVAGISNYNTLGSPAALRAVGAFFKLPERDYSCSKYVPKVHGKTKSLPEAREEVAEIDEFAKKYPEQWLLAQKIEGQFRSFGTHAAGVVVAAEPLCNRAVVEKRGEESVVNWDKRTVEDQGLVKMDILGLSNLDILKRCTDKIEWSYGKKIELLDIPLDDEKTLEAFGAGETVGCFQFESGGMRKLLKDLRVGGPLTFDDLAATTALFRPGPLDSGLCQDYVNVKQGLSSPFYDHPLMEPALKSTFGVITYQEQVMQVARDLAGFSMAEADHLRKAMGKKDPVKMAEQRGKFVEGCVRVAGVSEPWANNLFDKIEVFAGYGFNLSHAVEYSVISFWSQYLRVHYPHEYYAACLEVMKEERLESLVKDAAKRGIDILPPDINLSTKQFKRVGDDLLAPFSRVKGISEATENAILEARTKTLHGRFTDVKHLEVLVERRRCNVRHREHLERVGAFASITPGSKPARHPDRIRDQRELLPGLIIAHVKAERAVPSDAAAREAVGQIWFDMRKEVGGMQPLPRLGAKPKMMVVTDCPSRKEEEAGKMLEGDQAKFIKDALKAAGLTLKDIYFTSLVKAPKKDRQLSNDEINTYKPYFEREVQALKPPIIVALGSGVSRYLCPDEKGSIMDLSGKAVYNKERDAMVVMGIGAGMLWHDPSKQDLLDGAFKTAVELLS